MPNTAIPARVTGYQMTHFLRRDVTFADNNTARTLGVIPANAVVINGGVIVTTAFNAGTTNTLNIGTDLDDDGFASLIALGTVGRVLFDDAGTSDDLKSSADRTITATVVLTGTAATTGAATVFIEYLPADGI